MEATLEATKPPVCPDWQPGYFSFLFRSMVLLSSNYRNSSIAALLNKVTCALAVVIAEAWRHNAPFAKFAVQYAWLES